jgi:hypothetical protein
MQQTNKRAAHGFENSFDRLQFDEFVRDLALVILSKNTRDFEGVWDIANRVYDRWSATEHSAARSDREQDLALSA